MPTAARNAVICLAAALAAACATSPLGRRQLAMMPDTDMARLGAVAYDEIKSKETVTKNADVRDYVDCVADAVTAALVDRVSSGRWEVTVFEQDQANAFALPGAKIGVYTGLLDVATTQDQLAAVIGHEVAHVEARHANERVSTAYAAEVGMSMVGASGVLSGELMGLLGVGAQVGVLLPFSRTQEKEADLIGLDLMARAGFDPRESVTLWRNMSANRDSGAPPELLSTHPGDATRIAALSARLPDAMTLYERARAAGRKPACGP